MRVLRARLRGPRLLDPGRIGFDAVSTSGEEVREPSRDLPRAIIGPLAIARFSTSSSRPARSRSTSTLFAFIVVNIGVIILRRTRPDLDRGYPVPLVPWFPLIGTALCVHLMVDLERETWLRFIGWMAIGLVVYFLYGVRHSRLRRAGEVVNPDAEMPER